MIVARCTGFAPEPGCCGPVDEPPPPVWAATSRRSIDARSRVVEVDWSATPCTQKSPVSDETSVSNSCPVAVADTVTVPAGAPPAPNGPVCPRSVPQIPEVSGAPVVVAVVELPVAAAYTSGFPPCQKMSAFTGWSAAAFTANDETWLGTNQNGMTSAGCG